MSGYFYITCKNNGKVLDFEGSGKPAALDVLLTKEKDETRQTQLWKWDIDGRLINQADNKLTADTKEMNTEAGTSVILGSLTWAPLNNQTWSVCENSIHSQRNGLVMDATDSYVILNRQGKASIKHGTLFLKRSSTSTSFLKRMERF